MKTLPLPAESVALTGYSHKVIIEAADVAALATDTAALPIIPASGTFAAGLVCERVALKVVTPFEFSDGDINSLLAEVGDGGDTDRLCAQTETFSGSEVPFFASATNYAYAAADSIDVTFTAAGGLGPLLSACTVGELEVYLKLVNLNELESVA